MLLGDVLFSFQNKHCVYLWYYLILERMLLMDVKDLQVFLSQTR